ncbi:MAG: tail fiber domain-containing protein [Pyrinomonadaceae bacterium]
MSKSIRRIASALFLLFSVYAVTAQELPDKITPPATAPVITGTASAERLRFTAPSAVVQMHLQIYADSGQLLFDVTSKGNVLDWTLQDSVGERLAPGSYLCVVTVKSLSGKLSQRLGSALVQEKQIELRSMDATKFTEAQQQAVGPVEENGALTILKAGEAQAATVLANDGKEGQVVRGWGALTFRLGDFYSGTDQEQMRLTEDGKLGIGTKNPQSKLDVAGTIRAENVLITKRREASDGKAQTTDADDTPQPLTSGAGTQGRIVKWTDNSGTLGDSVVTEANGNIGVGNSNPASLVHIGSFGGYGTTTGLLLGNNLNGTMFDRSLQVSPVQIASPGNNSILLYALPTINSGVTVPKQYGFFVDGKQGSGVVTSYAALATGQTGNLGATNNTHLLMGQLAIPTGNYAIYDATGFRSYLSGPVVIGANSAGSLDVAGNINTNGDYYWQGSRILSSPGAGNLYVGAGAGTSNTSWDNNTFVGWTAGKTHTAGSSNTYLGYSTGESVSGTTTDKTTYIGARASSAGSLTNATAIGAYSFVTQSNSLVLGSINGVNNGADTNVGIGTSAPVSRLQVVTANDTNPSTITAWDSRHFVTGGTASNGGIGMSYDQSNNAGYVESLRPGVAWGNLIFQSGGGNVGIGTGTTAPNFKLQVNDSSNTGLRVQTNTSGGTVASFGGYGEFQIDAPGFPGRRLTVKENGNVGIGINVPDRTLTVNGTADKVGGGSWDVFSDERLKTIKGRFTPGLKALMQLQPIRYEYKPDNALGLTSSGEHIGFGAQAVQKIIPEAVTQNDSGYLLINNDPIIWTMLNAIKEQQQQILALKKEIVNLKTRIAKRHRRVTVQQ